jgi:hypothetical protein
MTEEYNWAAYKRGERAHNGGDHSICDPGRCIYAERLWVANDEHLRSLALLAELADQGLDATGILGDDYADIIASANAQFPGFAYLQSEPDFVHELQARVRLGHLVLMLLWPVFAVARHKPLTTISC